MSAGTVRAAAIALAAMAALGVGPVDAAPGAGNAASASQPSGTTRMMLGYRSGAAAAVKAAVAAAGGRVVADLDDLDGLVVDLPAAAVRRLQARPDVEFVENDPPRRMFAPRAPAASKPTAAPSGQTVPYGIPMVQADQVTDDLASDRKLCIVDSGIDRSHEDLQGISMDGANFSGSGDWFTDEAHHGTHVAGTIAAVNNTIGVVGVLPNKHINLYISKVFDATGSAASSVIVQGMRACMRARANIVSMSLGGSGASRMEQRAVTRMAARNMLLIAAAGNEGDADNLLNFPAGFAEVVSVAAVDSDKQVASFSQFNTDVELAGPGVGVLSTVPMGTGIDTAVTVGATPYSALPTDGPLGTASGPLADFGTGETAVPMTGKVCLIQRGNISFADKVTNCEANGGIGAIIYNNTAGTISATLGGAAVHIPSVTVTQADGQAMLGQLGQTATIALTPSNYQAFNGTSMATPHVSGVAALVWSHYTHCTADQIRSTLDKSAMDLGDPGRDVHYGFGLVQAKAAFDRIATMGCGN